MGLDRPRLAERVLERVEAAFVADELAVEQAADERHWAHEQYTLLVRLPDGFLFLINRNSGDRNEPARFGFKSQPQGALWAWLEGSVHYVVADFSRKEPGFSRYGPCAFTSDPAGI